MNFIEIFVLCFTGRFLVKNGLRLGNMRVSRSVFVLRTLPRFKISGGIIICVYYLFTYKINNGYRNGIRYFILFLHSRSQNNHLFYAKLFDWNLVQPNHNAYETTFQYQVKVSTNSWTQEQPKLHLLLQNDNIF